MKSFVFEEQTNLIGEKKNFLIKPASACEQTLVSTSTH